jgi:hypothetical protein
MTVNSVQVPFKIVTVFPIETWALLSIYRQQNRLQCRRDRNCRGNNEAVRVDRNVSALEKLVATHFTNWHDDVFCVSLFFNGASASSFDMCGN